LIAAYFATESSARSKRNGEIIAVQVDAIGLLSQAEMGSDPFAIADPKFVYPSLIAPRIGAQRGLFSIHSEPSKPWRLKGKTDRFPISGDVKPMLRDFLHGMGVDHGAIMADLDGVAESISTRLRSGKPLQ
jgi:hypothetical protein